MSEAIMTAVDAHFLAVHEALAKVETEAVERLAESILRTTRQWEHRPVLCCGNGGSAATAIHFAADLRSVGIQAWDLLSPSKVTQITNDVAPEAAFSAQCLEGALVVAFSGSGTSTNVERLLYLEHVDLWIVTSTMRAGRRAWDTYPFPGLNVIEVQSGDYEVVEDCHLAICHAVKKLLIERTAA